VHRAFESAVAEHEDFERGVAVGSGEDGGGGHAQFEIRNRRRDLQSVGEGGAAVVLRVADGREPRTVAGQGGREEGIGIVGEKSGAEVKVAVHVHLVVVPCERFAGAVGQAHEGIERRVESAGGDFKDDLLAGFAVEPEHVEVAGIRYATVDDDGQGDQGGGSSTVSVSLARLNQAYWTPFNDLVAVDPGAYEVLFSGDELRLDAGTTVVLSAWDLTAVGDVYLQTRTQHDRYLSGAIGELPPMAVWPEVWVIHDEDFERAEQIMRDVLPAE